MENSEMHCQNNMPELIGFDWNMEVVLGSSSLATLQQPLLGVDLYLSHTPSPTLAQLSINSPAVNHVRVEMNQAELKHLIAVLEKAYANQC